MHGNGIAKGLDVSWQKFSTYQKDYTIGAAPPSNSSYFYPLPIYIPIVTSQNELESNPRCSGLPMLMSPAKPLLPARLTESTESLAIDLVYVLQHERYAGVSSIRVHLSCIELQNVREMK